MMGPSGGGLERLSDRKAQVKRPTGWRLSYRPIAGTPLSRCERVAVQQGNRGEYKDISSRMTSDR